MKKIAAVLVVAGAAVALVASFDSLPLAQGGQDASKPDFVVHEWGTFTSMQGSDGVTLEGLQHEEEELPSFVYSRTEVRECPLRDRGHKGLEVDVTKVTEKMETPVTYFYSDKPLRARVRVCFNRGLLTQWYPVTDLLGPREGKRSDGPIDMSKIEKSFLEWDIEVLAPGKGASDVPAVAKGDPWQFARIPDSNCVRTMPRSAGRSGPSPETEKFLFYRGLGTFTLPIKATSEGRTLAIANDGDDAIRHVFVLSVKDGRQAFAYVPEVAARGSVKVERPTVEGQILPALREKLVAEGLTEREAEAMVRTWERSYFHTEGLRVLYVVPERVTDALLPIAITPAPKAIRRVLVGRLECITPEVEAEVEAALRTMDRARLEKCGRFLEAHVRRVLAMTKDETVRKNALEVLK